MSSCHRLNNPVLPHSPAAHGAVRELKLPEDCLPVSIFRDSKVLIPHGNTRLLPGDRLAALVKKERVGEFQQNFHEE